MFRYRLISIVLCLFFLFGTLTVSAKEESTDTDSQAPVQNISVSNYKQYLEQFKGKKASQSSVQVSIDELIAFEQAEIKEIENTKMAAISDGGFAEFSFSVSESALYQIELTYYTIAGNGGNINLSWSFDDEIPFYEIGYNTLYRVWNDEYNPGANKDSRGNDISPLQEEKQSFITTYISDTTGCYAEPFFVYLSKGEHRVRISSNRESVGIVGICFGAKEKVSEYSNVKSEYEENNYIQTTDFLETYEAEISSAKSDSTIYASYDKDSAKTTPYSAEEILLNTIGGTNYSAQGQWIEWEIEAPRDGLYSLTFRVKQNQLSGTFVTRSVYIDGKLPYKEADCLEINYSTKWQNVSLPYEFYLSKGTHTVRMEVSVGRLSEIITAVDSAVSELNDAYRKIIMITGTRPDSYRTYDLSTNIPEVFEIFKNQKSVIDYCNDQLIEKTGKSGSMNGILQTLSRQLESFLDDEDKIQKQLDSFKSNISSLSSWVVSMKSQPLQLDKFYLHSSNVQPPRANAGFFNQLLHELRCFIASFYVDYNTIGDYAGGSKPIEVWVQAGRDQANILKNLIISSFSGDDKPEVDLKLVQGQLMAATASGRGPDVALQVAALDPVNYATRGAACDLTQFEDYATISQRFRESAILPYEFNGGVYALPETQTYQVMFYRTDVLEELGLKPPKTWDEMFVLLGRLQKKNMTIGIQAPNSAAGSFTALSTMAMLLYQRNGEIYIDGNSASGLSTVEAQEVFEQWVSMYTEYEVPVSYNAMNRFRTGEMPIVIEDFSLYNLLQASAPEIQGMWEFCSVPGTEQENGEINNSVAGTGICCMILNSSKNKESAWEFVKWWTSAEIQAMYGKEIENKLGASARYPSANVEAFSKMPWSVAELTALNSLWENVKGIPEVAGGYFTSRHLNNAFRRVMNYGDEPKQTLLNYVENINKEITAKREELGIR